MWGIKWNCFQKDFFGLRRKIDHGLKYFGIFFSHHYLLEGRLTPVFMNIVRTYGILGILNSIHSVFFAFLHNVFTFCVFFAVSMAHLEYRL